MSDRRDEALLRRIRHELDHSVESLDGETRSRLAAEDALPSMDFLEFLGEWEDEDGAWVDSQMKAAAGEEQSQQEVGDNN